MTITLYRTVWSKPGEVEPIEVRFATDKSVWLMSGYRVPRHRDDYEDYWSSEEEALSHWLQTNLRHIADLESRVARARVLHLHLVDKYVEVCERNVQYKEEP